MNEYIEFNKWINSNSIKNNLNGNLKDYNIYIIYIN